MLRSAFLALLTLLSSHPHAAADSSVNLPLDHWAYGFVERCEARGLVHGVGDGIKPLSRLELAQILSAVAAAQKRGARLSSIEAEELRQLQKELEEEGRNLEGTAKQQSASKSIRSRLSAGQPLFRYGSEQGEMLADLLFRQQTDLFAGRGREEFEQIFRTRLGGVVRGHLRGVGFRIAFEQTREQGSRTYTTRDDVFEPRLEIPQLKGDLADYHQGVAYLVFSLPFVDVEFGKDEVAWGPGPADNLGLSRNAPAFDMLRLRTRLGAFKLVSIAGSLRPCPDRPDSPRCGGMASPESYIVNQMTRQLDREKYLAAHRLEVALAPWIDLGFQEVVVYGDRGPEVAYLNPIMFYWAAQSYLGDKDNLVMGLDVDLHPGWGVRTYLAYAIDDLKKLKIFSNDFANKFSLQAGLLWLDPLGLQDLDLRFEYVRLEPWVYTHKFPINTFSHFDAPLGHALGPNSDRWQVGLTRRFAPGLSVGLEFSRTRHGDNELLPDGSIRNVGGDLLLGWRPGDERESKKFLDGNLNRWTCLGGKIAWRVWPYLSVEGGFASEWGENVPLPPRWDADVPLSRRIGYGDGWQHHFTFDLRYGYF